MVLSGLVFYATYLLAELRRRSGRTIVTALGLAIGVGLVVTVSALSAGLDRAQAQVLEPLTGVGTDMSVTRPIDIAAPGQGGSPNLSDEERQRLREENRGGRLGLTELGEPGTRFSRDTFVSGPQLSFSASDAADIRELDGVSEAAGGLTLNSIHVEGIVPERTQAPGGFVAPAPGAGPPEHIDISSISVAGVDHRHEAIGAITAGQVVAGRYFDNAGARQAILNESYVSRQSLELGDTLTLGGKTFTVVGIVETPLGGHASDVYVKLPQLQALADRRGRINTVYVRAESADDVAALATRIEQSIGGASVTTAQDLAARVSGTLVEAKNLAGKLGTALMVIGLLSAFLIASLLTLSSVTKRVRELGTLKALGWSQRLVVRQVTGESLVQGVLGGALGMALGIAAATLIGALAPALEATVDAAAEAGPRFVGPFGQGAVEPAATEVALSAPVSVGLALAAVGLALLGGLFAGAAGSLRAARLRPADALRHVD